MNSLDAKAQLLLNEATILGYSGYVGFVGTYSRKLDVCLDTADGNRSNIEYKKLYGTQKDLFFVIKTDQGLGGTFRAILFNHFSDLSWELGGQFEYFCPYMSDDFKQDIEYRTYGKPDIDMFPVIYDCMKKHVIIKDNR